MQRPKIRSLIVLSLGTYIIKNKRSRVAIIAKAKKIESFLIRYIKSVMIRRTILIPNKKRKSVSIKQIKSILVVNKEK